MRRHFLTMRLPLLVALGAALAGAVWYAVLAGARTPLVTGIVTLVAGMVLVPCVGWAACTAVAKGDPMLVIRSEGIEARQAGQGFGGEYALIPWSHVAALRTRTVGGRSLLIVGSRPYPDCRYHYAYGDRDEWEIVEALWRALGPRAREVMGAAGRGRSRPAA